MLGLKNLRPPLVARACKPEQVRRDRFFRPFRDGVGARSTASHQVYLTV